MFNEKSTLNQSLKRTYLAVSSSNRKSTIRSGIVSEQFAIITCSLLIGVFAILILILMQAVAAVYWGIFTIWQLLNGKGLFQEEDEL
jgi:hypothetical protein